MSRYFFRVPYITAMNFRSISMYMDFRSTTMHICFSTTYFRPSNVHFDSSAMHFDSRYKACRQTLLSHKLAGPLYEEY